MENMRRTKDRFFAEDHRSPIPPEEQESFDGLEYYDLKEDLMMSLPLHEHEKKRVVDVEDTTGDIRRMIRWGEFRFEVNGRDCVLQAYKDDEEEQGLFIPFKDATSGKETYEGGRYLDLDERLDRSDDGELWIVDFNKAYNPFCAYGQNYSCPIPPDENRLDAPVRAGEKAYRH